MALDVTNNRKKVSLETIIFIIFLVLSFGLILLKLPYGIGGDDEAFYFTIPNRLMMGDGLFSDEWHVSQLSSIIIYPIYRLFYFFNGSNEGVVLFFRYVYLVFQTICTLIIYQKIKKYSWTAVFGSLAFFLFTPHNIMSLSYHSMGLAFVTLFCVFMISDSKFQKSNQFFAGVFLSLAVLCNPFLVSVYVIYSLAIFVIFLVKKKKTLSETFEKFSVKNWLWLSVGIVATASCFVVFLFMTTDITRVFENFQMIFNDPEHPSRSLKNLFVSYIASLFIQYKLFLAVNFLLFIVILIDKKRSNHAWLYLILISINLIYKIIRSLYAFNIVMFPLALLGVFAYVFSKKKNHTVFYLFYIPSLIYSFCLNASSNQYIYAISIGMGAVLVASVLLIKGILDEIIQNTNKPNFKSIIKFTAFVVAVSQIFAQSYVKINLTYWEPEIKEINVMIDNGPFKNLRTSIENADKYYSLVEDLEYYKDKTDERFLYIGQETWSYLYADLPYATFSAWSSVSTGDVSQRWLSYFDINKDNVPKYIYIKKGVVKNELQMVDYAQSKNYSLEETDVGYMLEKN